MHDVFSSDELLKILDEDTERTNLARKRQESFWNGDKPDAWPIMFTAPLTEEQEKLPEPKAEAQAKPAATAGAKPAPPKPSSAPAVAAPPIKGPGSR